MKIHQKHQILWGTPRAIGKDKKMFFKILKKDLKRSKTMNIILFLFIILATTFVASGLNNVISVISGMDYFLEQAVGEYDDFFILANAGKDRFHHYRRTDRQVRHGYGGYDRYR